MHFKRNKLTLIAASALVLAATSCSAPKDIAYLQGLNDGQIQAIAAQRRIVVRPDDRLAILVSSKDPELAQVFNLAISQSRIGQTSSSSNTSGQTASFVVSPEGDINYPILGRIHVEGLSRQQLASIIEDKLKTEGLLKDPIVTVEFLNATYAVLGDVSAPGEYSIDRDNLNLLQGLSKAGDLQITGQRRNVMVLRQEDGKDIAYTVDLTNPQSVMQSPAFHLQQNDIIYVEPNNMRKRQSTINGTSVMTPGFWFSIASFVASMSVLIFK